MLKKKIKSLLTKIFIGTIIIFSFIGITPRKAYATIKPFELNSKSIVYYEDGEIEPFELNEKSVIYYEKENSKSIKKQGKVTIVLDSGHDYNKTDGKYTNGIDSGAIAYDGTQEANINERLSKEIKLELEKQGIDVILTKKFSNTKTTLGERIKIGNQENVDGYISIHNNSNKNRKIVGTEVFYNKYGQPIAKEICQPLAEHLKTKNRGEKISPYYINKINKPAALVEVGFITNPKECEKVDNPSTARVIAKGIINWVNNSFK